MPSVELFLSTVSAEFRSYRDALRRDLTRPNVTVKVQEDFIATGTETLDKLDDYVRRCDAVIHLVGDSTGALAQAPSTALLARRYSDFAERLPEVAPFLQAGAPALSYTQWEAWLALYHRKMLIIAVPEDGAPREQGYRLVEADRVAQQEHLQRLATVERYPEIRFANADRLAVAVLRSKLQDVLACTEGPKTQVFASPWDFGPYVAEKRKAFEGRDWLFRDVASWLSADGPPALLVRADFGVGKSALMAELVHRNPGSCVAAWHFCQHDTQDTLHPGQFVRSVAAQLAKALPGYRALVEADVALQERLNRALEDASSAFEGGVLAPLARLPAPEEPQVLLIDALDEALELDEQTVRHGRNIVDLLAAKAGRFPPWLRVLATTRSNPQVLMPLQNGFAPKIIDAESAENLDDLQHYVLHQADQEPLVSRLREVSYAAQDLVDLLIGKSQGKFLLAASALRALAGEDVTGDRLRIRLDELAALPPGMDSWYLDAFKRRYAGHDYKPSRAVLGVLAAAREPLPPDTVAAVLGIEVAQVTTVRHLLPDFLRLRASGLTFEHFSLAEWLTRERDDGFPRAGTYAVDWVASQQRLHTWALAQVNAGRAHASGYLLRHLAAHLADDAERRHVYGELMLRHFEWLQARLDQDGVDALLGDVEHIKGLPEQPWLEAVLRNSAHVLRAHPEQLAAHVLGRVGNGLGTDNHLSLLAESVHRHLADPANQLRLLLPTSRSLRLATAHVATLEGGSVLAVLPDGRVASSGFDGAVRVCDPQRLTEPLLFKGHTSWVLALVVLTDGRLASGGNDGTVRVWDPQHRVEPLVFEGHAEEVTVLAALPDGRLASGSDDGTVRVWDPQRRAKPLLFKGHTGGIGALAVLPDGRLASGGSDGTVRVWNPQRRTKPLVFKGHTPWVLTLAVLPDGRLASGGNDGTVRVWDPQHRAESLVLKGHAGGVRALAVLPDGRLASGGNDGTVRVWDLQCRAEPLLLDGHTSWIRALAMLADGRLASGSLDGTVRVWDLQRRAEPLLFDGHALGVSALAVLPNERLASAGNDGTVRVWDPQRRAEPLPFDGHVRGVSSLVVLPDGRLASSSPDDTVRVWDPTRRSKPQLFEEHALGVIALAVLPDGRLALGSSDDTVRVWDPQHRTKQLSEHARGVNVLAVLPDGRLAFGSDDGTVRVWDPQRRAAPVLLEGHAGPVRMLAALPDGRLASGSDDGTVRVWDPQHLAELLVLEGHAGGVRALAVLPDGRLASGAEDDAVRVWSLQRCAKPLLFEGHAGGVNALAVLPGGRLASGSSDRTVRVWDLQRRAEPMLFEGHTSGISALAVLPNGRIASGAVDCTVRVWDLTRQTSMVVFCADAFVSCLAVTPGGLIVAGCGDGTVHFLRQAGE